MRRPGLLIASVLLACGTGLALSAAPAAAAERPASGYPHGNCDGYGNYDGDWHGYHGYWHRHHHHGGVVIGIGIGIGIGH